MQEEESRISQKWNQPPTTSNEPTTSHSGPTTCQRQPTICQSTNKTRNTMKSKHTQLQSEDRGQHDTLEPWTTLEGLVDCHLSLAC